MLPMNRTTKIGVNLCKVTRNLSLKSIVAVSYSESESVFEIQLFQSGGGLEEKVEWVAVGCEDWGQRLLILETWSRTC